MTDSNSESLPDSHPLYKPETYFNHFRELGRRVEKKKITSVGEIDLEGEVEWFSRLEACKVDPNRVIPPPPKAITIGGVVYGTLGNFSVIIGKAKSRKSFVATLLSAATLNEVGSIRGHLPPDKNRVLYFDTEQAEYHVSRVAQRIAKLADEPSRLSVYRLRECSTAERLEMVAHALNHFENVGLVVIDGIRDLAVKGINDEETATELADMLLYFSGEKRVHIIVLLHQNKGDNHARGHLGTELINKAETVVTVTKDSLNQEISIISPEFVRNREFEPFAIIIDEEGFPKVVDVPKRIQTTSKNEKERPTDVIFEDHQMIISELQKHQPREGFGYQDVIEQVKLAYGKVRKKNIGNSIAREWKTFYENLSVLEASGKEKSKGRKYNVHPQAFSINTFKNATE